MSISRRNNWVTNVHLFAGAIAVAATCRLINPRRVVTSGTTFQPLRVGPDGAGTNF
jgi:hypothetical protein